MAPRSYRALITTGVVACALLSLGALGFALPKTNPLARPGTLQPLGPLYSATNVTQEFVAEGDGLDAVELTFATYRRVNKGMLSVTMSKLMGERWQVLDKLKAPKRALDDNANHRFVFHATLPVHRGDRLALKLTVNGSESNAIAWYFSPDWHLTGAKLDWNDRAIDGTAHFQPLYRMRGRLGSAPSIWWERITIMLNPVARWLLALAALLTLVLFVHMSLWWVDENEAQRSR